MLRALGVSMDEIETVVRTYVAASGTDMTLAATFFEEPATVAGPRRFLLIQTKEEVVKFLEWSFETVQPLGYAKSTCEHLSIKMLNPVMALCSVIYARRASDNTELQRSGVIYVLRKGDHGWKIRNVLATDLDKML
jgi:hypothetical protein